MQLARLVYDKNWEMVLLLFCCMGSKGCLRGEQKLWWSVILQQAN